MTQQQALELIQAKPWYSTTMYLEKWQEQGMVRHCITNRAANQVVGWGRSWSHAMADADRRYVRDPFRSCFKGER